MKKLLTFLMFTLFLTSFLFSTSTNSQRTYQWSIHESQLNFSNPTFFINNQRDLNRLCGEAI